MKKYFFLCGLPRSGNTLFGSLLNQNKKISVTANSIVSDILYNLSLLENNLIFKNFPDFDSLNNVTKNVFNNYYKKWESDIIIDRAPWGTPQNLYMLKRIIEKPKFIILHRPILEILASFVKLEDPGSIENIENFCDDFMNKHDGIVGKYLWSINNIINNQEEYILLNYHDLVKDPKKEINKICNFINIPYEEIKIKNFDQFKVNNIKYDDNVFHTKLHEIRTDKISSITHDLKSILNEKIINKYKNWNII